MVFLFPVKSHTWGTAGVREARIDHVRCLREGGSWCEPERRGAWRSSRYTQDSKLSASSPKGRCRATVPFDKSSQLLYYTLKSVFPQPGSSFKTSLTAAEKLFCIVTNALSETSISITEYVVVTEWPSWQWLCSLSQQARIQLHEDSCLGRQVPTKGLVPRLAADRLRLPPVPSGSCLGHSCGHLHVFLAKPYFTKTSASGLCPSQLLVMGNHPAHSSELTYESLPKVIFPASVSMPAVPLAGLA